jgi:hypothetical protein
MSRVKDLAGEYVNELTYDVSTEELVKMLYRYMRIDLDTIKALDLVLGTKDIPKWSTVVRRVQKRKVELKEESYIRAHS